MATRSAVSSTHMDSRRLLYDDGLSTRCRAAARKTQRGGWLAGGPAGPTRTRLHMRQEDRGGERDWCRTNAAVRRRPMSPGFVAVAMVYSVYRCPTATPYSNRLQKRPSSQANRLVCQPTANQTAWPKSRQCSSVEPDQSPGAGQPPAVQSIDATQTQSRLKHETESCQNK